MDNEHRIEYGELSEDHNLSGEELDAIIYSGKPSALPTVTWEGLGEIEQDLLKTLDAIGNPVSMLWTDINRKMIRLGLIAKVSRGIDTTFKATLTEAGRALLPAGEAVDVPKSGQELDDAALFLMSLAQRDADVVALQTELAAANERAAAAAFDNMATIGVLMRERDDALARAAAAEDEIKRLRKTLEWYADYANYREAYDYDKDDYLDSNVANDAGEKAQKALGTLYLAK